LFPESLDRCQEQPAANYRRIDPADEIAGNKDEELGGVAEAVVSQCQPRHDIVRDVIKEDHPQSKPAEEIEPEITSK